MPPTLNIRFAVGSLFVKPHKPTANGRQEPKDEEKLTANGRE
jgi:hypothetical protein